MKVGKGALLRITAGLRLLNGVFDRLHSEGRIVYTIFGLLFWDIIFTTIPGAFETPFQVAPLDIDTDTFYHSRRELFEKRLEEIKEGKAREIVGNVYSKHRDKETLCVGVRWDLVEEGDLEDIVEVRDDTYFLPIRA
jgi:Fanconi-associated nuclease 1